MTRQAPPLERRDAEVAAAVAAGLGLLYWVGRCRTFGPGDSPQHVLAAILWGVPVAPGYPLQVALGRLLSLLPGSPSANVNGLSGLAHAAAAAFFYLTLRRLALKRLPALVATSLMALSPLYWYYSEVAEVRALNDLFALAAAYWAASWSAERKPAALAALAAVLGLGISHHPTYVLILPALAYWLWSGGAAPRGRKAALFAVGAAAFAVLPYALLALRVRWSVPAYNYGDVRTWRQVWDLFTRHSVGGPLHMISGGGVMGFDSFNPANLVRHAYWFAQSILAELSPAGVALAAAGGAALWKSGRRTLAFWAIWLALSAGVFIAISSQQLVLCDNEYLRAVLRRYYLLPLISLFALAGFGTQALLERVRPAFGWALLAAALAGPLLLRRFDLRGHDPLMAYAREIVRDTGASDMVILVSDDSVFAMTYLELVERSTADRVLLSPTLFTFPPYIRRLHRQHPELKLPLSAQGLSKDWRVWLSLNPGRGLFGEATLRETLRSQFPDSAPCGALVEVRRTAASRGLLAERARAFLDHAPWPSASRWNIYPFTQEVYLRAAYRDSAEWYGALLTPGDPALAEGLGQAVSAL